MSTAGILSRLFTSLMALSLLVGGAAAGKSQPLPVPRNIILMIGDGMGYNHTLAASYFRNGVPNTQVYLGFPVQVAVSTYPAGSWGYDPALAWNDFLYVLSNATDSAAAATAMAGGVKTNNGAIGVDVNGNAVRSVFEAAEAGGKSTGVVSTVPFSHATPAGFVAHSTSRYNYIQIANQMIFDAGTDVIMGAGNPWYDNAGQHLSTPNTYNYVGGQVTWDALAAGQVHSDRDGDGMDETAVLVQTRAEFQALMSGNTPEFVVGIAQVFTTLQQGRPGDTMADPFTVPFNSNVPNLSEISLAAINILDEDSNGFALMIEGGAIDWAAHGNQPGRMIEEQMEFDQAVEAVVSWIETNSSWAETLLIITADHETGYLWGPGSNPSWQPLVNQGVGNLPGMQFYWQNHTNSLVALYAKGQGSHWFNAFHTGSDPVRGVYIDNTSIARVIFKALSPYAVYAPSIRR